MRVNLPNLLYAVAHPKRAIRYVRYRDSIPYSDISRFLPPDPVIVEAGAHDGSNTVEMALHWPSAVIHAFEPVAAAAAVVGKRIASYGPRVTCHPVGLGPYDGEIEMHISGEGASSDCQSSSMLAPTGAQLREFPNVRFQIVEKVPMRMLDSWADSVGVTRVDFMWLDMQGYELRALEGASRLLQSTSAVHIEVSNVRLYEGAPLYPEVRSRMAQWGFVPAIEAFFRISGNVLFVRQAAAA